MNRKKMKTKYLLFLLLALAPRVHAQETPAQRYLQELAEQGPLKNAAWGVLAVDADGKVLARHNAGQRLVPASTLKLVTTGAALHAFGPEHRFQTQLGYTGTIGPDGTLEGDVYILGGGDPTLGAKDTIALKPEVLFWKWKTLLRDAGIQRIHGRIVGDGSAWEGMLEHPGWNYDDTGTYYGTGANALCFYGNAIDLEVRAGAQAGDSVILRQKYPETPWMHLSNRAFTGPAGTGNSLYLYTTDLAPYAELRGTFATDRRPKTEHFANKFGALTCARYFRKNLLETGWEVTGGYADVAPGGWLRGPDFVPAEKAGTPRPIGTSESPELRKIVRETLVRSDNFYAESIFRAMGEAATGIAVYDSCRVALNQVLEGLGVPLEGIRQADGSGLSRLNHLSPEWMVGFLQAMQQSPAFPDFLQALPHPGQGTLSVLLAQHPAAGRICLKSGSMDGVLCYSGYLLDAQGKPAVTLALMTNNTTAPVAEVRAVLARLLLYLLP